MVNLEELHTFLCEEIALAQTHYKFQADKRRLDAVKTGVDNTETTQVTLKQRERERKEIDI